MPYDYSNYGEDPKNIAALSMRRKPTPVQSGGSNGSGISDLLIPALSIVETIVSKGKSPGTSTWGIYNAQKQNDILESQGQEQARMNALDTQLKGGQIVKQNRDTYDDEKMQAYYDAMGEYMKNNPTASVRDAMLATKNMKGLVELMVKQEVADAQGRAYAGRSSADEERRIAAENRKKADEAKLVEYEQKGYRGAPVPVDLNVKDPVAFTGYIKGRSRLEDEQKKEQQAGEKEAKDIAKLQKVRIPAKLAAAWQDQIGGGEKLISRIRAGKTGLGAGISAITGGDPVYEKSINEAADLIEITPTALRAQLVRNPGEVLKLIEEHTKIRKGMLQRGQVVPDDTTSGELPPLSDFEE